MSICKVKGRGASATEVDEFLVESADDAANLPTDAAPGSIAYTADLTYVAMKDINGEWKAAIEEENDG
jgi:hypothetical protein